MPRDARGLPVSSASSEVIDAIDRFTVDFLDARDSAGAILDLAEQHHDCALVQCYAAALHLYSQSRAAIEARAAPLLARARATSPDLTERERLLLEALEAWARGDLLRAIAHLEELTGRWPSDIVAGKFGEFLFFEAPDYARHLRFMERMAAANAGVAAFHAMHSFALELAGRDERAEAVAHEAIRLERDTPWAHHTLGHLHLNQGRLDEGIAVLSGLSDTWSGHSRSMRTHNTWHLALFHLARLDVDAALALYEPGVWGEELENVFEHTDAISLLWRLDLAGRPAPEKWAAIAPHIAARANEQVFPFLNAHYVYALTRAGQLADARDAVERLRRYGATCRGADAELWSAVGVPLVEGCVAFAQGDMVTAAARLGSIMPEVTRVGGSDAQNDLFAQTYLVSLIETDPRAAAARLARRVGARPPTPLEEHWLAQL